MKNIYFLATEDLKVFALGQTERSFNQRHKDSDWSKFHNFCKAYELNMLVIGWWENTNIVDHDIHKWLKKQPTIEKYAEWFSHKTDLYILKDKLDKEFFSEKSENKPVLELRKHQKEFLAKAQADYLEFLLFAKCRSGKSAMTLSHIINRGFKVTLVVSRYTSPIQSWREDSNRYANFRNIVFIDLNDRDYLNQINYWMLTDKQLILWSCIQNKKNLNLPVNVDLIVYDEAHIGYNSNQWNKLRSVIQCPTLYVTGTAYDMVWEFTSSNKFVYSYFEEQYDKKIGLNNSPSMNIILAKYDTKSYQNIFNDDPDALKNVLRAENNKFVDPAVAADFLNFIFNGSREVRPKDRLLVKSKKIYMTMPSVDSCHAAKSIIAQTRYAPLVVTGETKEDVDSIKKHLEENEFAVILTRTANVLGVTVDVDTVLNCAEGKSIEFWTQFAFRGGSGENDWDVIDFCPERCLESLRQLYISASEYNPNVSQYSLLDYVSISEWSDGFTKLNQDDITRILAQDVSNSVRLVSGLASCLDFSKLNELEFQVYLKSASNNISKKIILSQDGANGKSNRVRVDELKKNERDEIYDKIETVKSILERIPLALFHSLRKGEILNNTDSLINSYHYQPNTGDTHGILRTCLNEGIIDSKALSYRLNQAINDIQYAIEKDECQTLHELSTSGQDHKSIPLELFNQILSEIRL